MLLNLETLDRESAMALGEGANASAADAWDDESWDDLLAYIEAGSVVPIIGPACYPVEIDGRTTSLDRHVAEASGSESGIADGGNSARQNTERGGAGLPGGRRGPPAALSLRE